MRTKGPGESALLLLDAVAVLRKQGVGYAVIGALAASVHGIVRASLDADAVLSLPLSGLSGLERALQAAGFQTELRHGDADDPIGSLLALTDQFGNRVDLLAGLRGLEDSAWRSCWKSGHLLENTDTRGLPAARGFRRDDLGIRTAPEAATGLRGSSIPTAAT